MTGSETIYVNIAKRISSENKDTEVSQMFGKPCLKVSGKAFACFFNGDMVFKLSSGTHAQALALKGSKLFDPSGKGMAMKEWVQVKPVHSAKWHKLAEAALTYVASTVKKR